MALSALRALGQEHRLTAFRALVAAGPDGLTVGELRELVDVPAATLSAHLNTLRGANLVADTREGRVIRVRADYERMNALLGFLTENCCGDASPYQVRGRLCAPKKKASRANVAAINAR